MLDYATAMHRLSKHTAGKILRAFYDGVVHAFEYFSGVPKRVVFDNAKVAVKDGFDVHAVKQDGYATLSVHYGSTLIHCT